MININEKFKNTLLMIGFLIAFLLIIVGLYFNLRDTKQKQVLPDENLTAQVEDIQEEPIEDYWDFASDFDESNEDVKPSVPTELIVEYDYSQVPVNINGLHLANNNAWLTYYASCKNADAYVCSATDKGKVNYNFIKISGKLYKLPFYIDDIPEEYKKGIVMGYSIFNKTQIFEGDSYFLNENNESNYLNGMHLQVFPTSELVNAIGVARESSCDTNTDLVSIAGLDTSMTEDDVIRKYGYGIVSNKNFSNKMIKEMNLPVITYQSRIYKNGSAILVVTFDDNRRVESIFLYHSILNRDPDKEKYTINEKEID